MYNNKLKHRVTAPKMCHAAVSPPEMFHFWGLMCGLMETGSNKQAEVPECTRMPFFLAAPADCTSTLQSLHRAVFLTRVQRRSVTRNDHRRFRDASCLRLLNAPSARTASRSAATASRSEGNLGHFYRDVFRLFLCSHITVPLIQVPPQKK